MTSPGPQVAEGDVLDLVGVYSEYKDLTAIIAQGWTMVGQVEVPQLYATAAELMSDPEAWESCVLQVTDGLIVNEILPDGDWVVVSFEDGITNVRLDPYWYDPSDVELGQCYNNATGMFIFHEGAYCLKVFPDGLTLTDCTVDAAPISFGAVKSLYR